MSEQVTFLFENDAELILLSNQWSVFELEMVLHCFETCQQGFIVSWQWDKQLLIIALLPVSASSYFLWNKVSNLKFLSASAPTSASQPYFLYLSIDLGRSQLSSLCTSQPLFRAEGSNSSLRVRGRRGWSNFVVVRTPPFLSQIGISVFRNIEMILWQNWVFCCCHEKVDPTCKTVQFYIREIGDLDGIFSTFIVSSSQLSICVVAPGIDFWIATGKGNSKEASDKYFIERSGQDYLFGF